MAEDRGGRHFDSRALCRVQLDDKCRWQRMGGTGQFSWKVVANGWLAGLISAGNQLFQSRRQFAERSGFGGL